MLTFLTPSFSDPVCLTVVQIFAKASQVVLFWIGKARGRSGELGTLGVRGRTFTACIRVFPAPRTRSMRRYLGVSWNFLVGIMLVQEQRSQEMWFGMAYSSRVESCYSVRLQHGKNWKSSSREEFLRLRDLVGPVAVLKRAEHNFSRPQSIE